MISFNIFRSVKRIKCWGELRTDNSDQGAKPKTL